MKKNILFVILLSFLLCVSSLVCYADEPQIFDPGWYKIEGFGWVYLKEDRNFAVAEWLWINASNPDNLYRHYYFNQHGFLEMSTLTPDGKWVNENGEEVANGQVLLANNAMGTFVDYTQIQNVPQDIPANIQPNSSEQNINLNYSSIYMEYGQKMLNRALSYSRMIENELTPFDIYNGKADEILKEYKDNLTKMFDEGMGQIALINQYKQGDAYAIQESNNYILYLQATYNQCLTKLNDAINVVQHKR